MTWLRQFLCGLFSDHKEFIVKRERGRVWMECQNCNFASTGWAIAVRKP